MTINFKNIVLYGLVISLVVILIVTITGCSKSAAPSAASTASPSAPSASTSSSGTPTPTFARQRPGVIGSLTEVSGNTLTVSSVQGGQVNVTISSNTLIQKTISGSTADLKQGDFLTVIGTTDASGNVTASSMVLRQQGQGQGSFVSGFPNSGSGFPGNGTGRGTAGTITGISGNSLTLNTFQGSQVTVSFSPGTPVEETTAGTAADLKTGESLTVMGTPDASGNIAATLIIIVPQGQETPPAPAPSSTVTPTPAATTSPASSNTGPSSTISTSIPTPSPVEPSTLVGGPPVILMLTPSDVSTVPTGDVTISTIVSNFNLVEGTGQANVAGEGHIIYYMDVTPPAIQGQSALTAKGTYAESTDTSYTWHNVEAGFHYFSAELVNNDNTPLSPAVTVTVYVTVQGTSQSSPSPSSTSSPAPSPAS